MATESRHLTPTQRGELYAYLRKRNLPASVAQRMRIVLLLDEGSTYRDIEEKLGTLASCAISGSTRKQPNHFSGNTPTSASGFLRGSDSSGTAH